MAGSENGRAEGSKFPIEETQRLIDLLRESGVGEIKVRLGEMEITVKSAPVAPVQAAASHQAAPELPSEEEASAERDEAHTIRSPLVGTFYRAPAPGEESYVEVGDKVKAGQPLCIVEAMKLMNEIPADVPGEIVEILAENSEGVQYDQPLFRIRPEG
jgi:acetyl-CoA carboxylase biotin carboxyl carrier protein